MDEVTRQLVESAARGEVTAFEALVKKYDRKVITLALKYTRSEEDAKDIYQEVFIRVWRSLPDFGFKSEFSTWLFRVTTNVCLTHLDKRKRHFGEELSAEEESDGDPEENRRHIQIKSDDPSPLERLKSSEIHNEILKAVDLLPDRQTLVFTMKYYEEFKISEIAEATGLSQGTIKRYLFDATNKLKHALKQFYQGV